MKAVIALPDSPVASAKETFQLVSGVPLLTRLLATAFSAGVRSAVVLTPRSIGEPALRSKLAAYAVPIPELRFVTISQGLDLGDSSSQADLAEILPERFLCLPWNLVTTRQSLRHLLDRVDEEDAGFLANSGDPNLPGSWTTSASVVLNVGSSPTGWTAGHAVPSRPDLPTERPAAILVRSAEDVGEAEALLALESGKPTDKFYSNLNRGLCRPLVRWVARTRITANMISLAGLPVSVLAGLAYSVGNYWMSLAGALLYFFAVELDEMDGMIARMKFQESPLGNKLENFVDFVTYLALWSGVGVGLYRTHGEFWLWVTVSILVGTVMSYVMQTIQKKLATSPDRPQDHVKIVYAKFDGDKGNPLSWISRRVHPLTKKGSLTHSLSLLTALNIVPVFFFLSMVGSHGLWIFGMYANRFFRPASLVGVTPPTFEEN